MSNTIKNIIFPFLAALWLTVGSAQIHYGNLYLHSQAEVDSIADIGYSKIMGDLVIGHQYGGELSDITDISGLMSIQRLNGGLFIVSNPNLSSLHGLDSIYFVEYMVWVENNDALHDLHGLEKITLREHIPSFPNAFWIFIYGNDQLTSLDGFPVGVTFLEDLTISSNKKLTDLSAVSGLETVWGVDIWYNDKLPRIEGAFNNLDSVRSIEIVGNSSLKRINDFHLAHGYIVTFTIEGNDSLETIVDFDDVDSIGRLKIIKNSSLETVDAFQSVYYYNAIDVQDNANLLTLNNLFDNMEKVGRLKIINNNRLQSFGPLSRSFCATANDIEIKNNDSLTSVVGLKGLKRIEREWQNEGDILLIDNPLLTLDGLDSLSYLVGGLSVVSSELADITALSSLATVEKWVKIQTPVLKALDGLENLSYAVSLNFVADSLSDISAITDHSFYLKSIHFSECNSLDSIYGFSHMVSGSFSKGMEVWDNRSLKKIAGFDMVSSMEYLRIVDNPSLQIISGFANLSLLGSEWGNYLYDNPSLQDASGLCHLFTDGEMEREMEIYDNAPGFNSKNEIIQWCILPTENIAPLSDAIRLYPNPVVDEFTVDLPEELLSNSTIVQLVDFSGRIIIDKEIHRSVTTLSVTNITGGLYLLKVLDDRKMVAARKLMIINNQ